MTAAAGPGRAQVEEETHLSDRDFERVRARIYEIAGIVIEPQKRQMVHARLSRRLRAHKLASFSEYLDRLDAAKDPSDIQDFVNAITTNLTSFFREVHHFEHLGANVLANVSKTSRMRIWSAGCSTGEEPYSVALVALSAPGGLPDDCKILATDLDTNVLEKAKAGAYAADKAEGALAPYGRLFTKDADAGLIHIGEAARRLISFKQLNLLNTWPMRGHFDAIFCRNVLIYFNAETKARLVARFAEQLKPGGYLYLGHSESILGEHPLLEVDGLTTYRRRQ
ncbi:MAG: protein-glutamate O-methyltransferase CheR [Pseudomonadota bacterium]